MCGIFGWWNRDGAPLDLRSVGRAAAAIRHRGPDDEGYLLVNTRSGVHVPCGGRDTTPALMLPSLDTYAGQPFNLALAFRRLSIIDLSPAGHQPMASTDGNRWIVFNGEIYNFVELRSELQSCGHRFRSNSDTEVILAAYVQWGDAAIERLRGMFALAVWDAVERRLLLARDRFGIKPLFVMERGASLLFGSELKTFGAATEDAYEPNAPEVAAFVTAARMPNALLGETFFRGITSLPAARRCVYTEDGSATERYWRIPLPQTTTRSPEAVTEEYRDLFLDAVRIHLRSDVPVGTCLSGGLDSASIVAAVMQLQCASAADPIRSFSAIYSSEGPWNERLFIDRVVARTGALPHYVEPQSDALFSELPALIWHQEEPFAGTSIFAQWCVMRAARRNGVPVLLDGQGADELLGGYHSFYRDHLRATLFSHGPMAAIAEAWATERVAGRDIRRALLKEAARSAFGVIPGVPETFQRRRLERGAAQAALRERPSSEALMSWIAPGQRDFATTLRRAAEEDPLPHLLRFEDRNSMAFSVEARVPFLDHRLFEFVCAEADGLRMRDGWTKWLHRAAFEHLLPHEIVWRRQKIGFATPQQHWLAERVSQIREAFAPGHPVDQLLVTSDIRRRVSRPGFVSQNGGLVWRWLCVAAWAEVFLGAASVRRGRESGAGAAAATHGAGAQA